LYLLPLLVHPKWGSNTIGTFALAAQFEQIIVALLSLSADCAPLQVLWSALRIVPRLPRVINYLRDIKVRKYALGHKAC
jgi:hypothetical protein